MSRFGPTRGEWRFRLIFSLCGLALLVAGLIYRRDMELGPGAVETIVIAVGFFGGTAVLAVRRLMRSEEREED